MELKEGMYVRTKYGITQYREYEINNCGLLSKIICMPVKCCNEGIFANTEDIIGEPSFNIIDLIEDDDYVNGYPVTVENMGGIKYLLLDCDKDMHYLVQIYDDSEIKSIVTKEMFSSVSYEVK